MSLSQAKRAITESCPDRFYPLIAGLYQTVFPPASGEGGDASTVLDQEAAVPESLPAAVIEDTRALPHRTDLLEHMPTGGTVAEFGTGDGSFAESISQTTAPETLFLVDQWDSDEERRAVERRFRDHRDTVHLRDAEPISVLRDADTDSLDWVYINSSHEYGATLAELRESGRAVADDGYIAGDDYKMINGVIPAIHQFCAETDWQLAYLTLETHGRRSYALRKQ
ncbi:class I SAM-dependent methyltransferase [Haloarcula sp. S1AR25-5A]|uniref:Class I SAM-dependent methyltransferase n=1 Tax=Haloarcula terrestris TaxID=2950533 RepID=A0AAE4JJY1_9EURY|nr:class I SAM-dependent methyltransferase [Haloarcula terrestris]MDS0222754.1 class I SAM-dependent methyltransferase [Haloarcula terrestris]